jgi:anti-sigma-K factor RskA
MSDENHVLDLLPAYVLGTLDANEASRVNDHLLSCLVCRTGLSVFQNVAEQIALSAPDAVPSPDLKDRLMQRVRTLRRQGRIPTQARRTGRERLLPVWGLMSLFLILALTVFNLSLWQRLNRLEFLTAPGGMRAIPLNALDAAPQASGFVLIGADGRNGALVVDRLPPLEATQEYQLWLIRHGQRTSGAVFSTDEAGYRGLRIEAPASLFEYTDVEVTIEPAGGSLRPTGVIVLRGRLLTP